jgi:hypothetical protein
MRLKVSHCSLQWDRAKHNMLGTPLPPHTMLYLGIQLIYLPGGKFFAWQTDAPTIYTHKSGWKRTVLLVDE